MIEMTCMHCGTEGVVKAYGLYNDDSLKVFRRLGRNHVSGHLHYQCPVCRMVLLVDPALIRAAAPLLSKSAPDSLVPSGSAHNIPGIYPSTSAFMAAVPCSAGSAIG